MSMVTTKSSQQHKKCQDEDSVNVSPRESNVCCVIPHRRHGAHCGAYEPRSRFFFVSQTAVSRSRKEAMMGVWALPAA